MIEDDLAKVRIRVYPDMLDALSAIKPEDQNLTQFINNLMRQHLTEEATK